MSHATSPDPEAVAQALRAISAAQGFNAWLGVTLLRVETGAVEIAVETRPDLTQHHGTVHGGVVAALADIVCAWTAASVAGDVTTGGISIQFLRPAVAARLRAEGAALKAGRRQISVEARIFDAPPDEPERLVAVALASVFPVSRS